MAQAPFTLRPDLVAIANDYATVNSARRGYIADRVIPRVRVDSPAFTYPEFPVDEAFAVYDTQVDRLGRLNEITSSAGETAGAVKDWGLMEPVPYRDQAAAQSANIPLNPLARAARNVTDKVQMAREVRASNVLFSSANYQTGYKTTLNASTSFAVDANDPTQVLQDAALGMLVGPNTAVMSARVRNRLRRHPKVSVALGGSAESGRAVSDEELATALGVDRVIIGNTIRATTKRGQTLSTGYIWGDHIAMIYLPPGGPDGMVDDANSPAFALTFQWGDNVAGTIEDPYIGLWGGQRVKAGESLIEKQVAPFAGYFFENVLAV
jgi:hypothetical protein